MRYIGIISIFVGLTLLFASSTDVLAHTTTAWGNPYAGYTRVTTRAGSTTQSPQAPNESVTPTDSRNWSGYVSASGTYTEVNGSWTVSAISDASSGLAADATWVGIGGLHTRDLIQAGTQAVMQNGQVEYQAWYETLPNASEPLDLNISAGDSVTAAIAQTAPNIWLITLTDNTSGKSASATVDYHSSEASAEWIEEMPSDTSGNFIPLDSFGAITFTGAQTVRNGQVETVAGAGSYPLTMTNGEYTLATTSALNGDGQSFTVTRSSGTSSVSSPGIVQDIPTGFARRGHTEVFTSGPFTIRVTFF